MKTLLVLLALSGFGLRWMPTNELWIRHSSSAPALGLGIKFAIGVAAKAAKRNNPATE